MRWLAWLLVGLGCGKPDSPDARFWSWFSAHASEVATIKRADEPIANQLAAELHKVDPGLVFQVSASGDPRELIISADGHRAIFPTVKRLVAAAPPIQGWTVIAFRPRVSPPGLQLGDGKSFKVTDLRFRLLAEPKPDWQLDVAIYVTGHDVDDATKSAVFILLDSWLGEYDVETYLGRIQILEGGQAPAGARPFSELVRVVDSHKGPK